MKCIFLSVMGLVLLFSTFATAEELKIRGTIVKIDGDKITLKDCKNGNIVTLIAKEPALITKLNSKIIVVDDFIAIRYDSIDKIIKKHVKASGMECN